MELKEIDNAIGCFFKESDTHFGFSIMSDGNQVLFTASGEQGQMIAMVASAMENNSGLRQVISKALTAYNLKNYKSKNQS